MPVHLKFQPVWYIMKRLLCASVVQWIRRKIPILVMWVRFPPEVPFLFHTIEGVNAMKIAQYFQPGKTVFSMEIFPPKKTSSIDTIYETLEQLQGTDPAYISVTYGAGGSVVNNATCEIASLLQNQYKIDAMAHLTCVNCNKEDVDFILARLKADGVENILALRGDKNPNFTPKEEFKYASDLVAYIKEKGDFHIAGACYPETHGEAQSPEADIANLKLKVDAGVSSLTSQLFFDNNAFYNFLNRARNAGIAVPVEAGIMPVTTKNQIERMVTMCGASLPPKFVKIMQRYEHNPEALRDAGIAYAIDQIVDLISSGVDGIHLYAMNNPYVATKIKDAIHNLL